MMEKDIKGYFNYSLYEKVKANRKILGSPYILELLKKQLAATSLTTKTVMP